MDISKLKTLKKRNLAILGGVLSLAIYAAYSALGNYWEARLEAYHQDVEENIKHVFNRELFQNNQWPSNITVEGEEYQVNYTLNNELNTFVRKLLKRYRSDYSTVVVIDNATGEIISAVGYEKDTAEFNKNLVFSSTHPAASLFKVVTSADLLQNSETEPGTKFNYRGKGTTLYKYQLKNKKTRWTRSASFKKAFASSNNVIFGKAAISGTSAKSLFQMATTFGFNQELMPVVASVRSSIEMPSDDYGLAELASGFNKETLISPIHGALLSSIVANGGIYRSPTIVKEFVRNSDGEKYWNRLNLGEAVIDKKTTDNLKGLMEATVKAGTARKHFNRMNRKLRSKLAIGGKTGSITGGLPHGKRDWFTSYAVPKNGAHKGISICVMNINVKKWYVKSTFLAKNIIEYYYKKVAPINGPVVTADYVRK